MYDCIITDSSQKENLGIIVQYKVKVKLNLGPLVGDLVAELPFTLMHPKPEEEPEVNNKPALPPASSPTQDPNSAPAVDTNLIELDTDGTTCYADQDDDIIFEDFARLRLKGETEA
ncbi:Beta-arrestin-1 [Penaeus vannamei]|uniref:Beta-arrestin-1 n=1 Tax=Penaeus vannamei TaxID=6689 RepID=A0A3R7QLF0_PENVA|nr:Beta-arrestin-1 [Penaeus vannamei]